MMWVSGAVPVGDDRRALGEEGTRALNEECARVDGPWSGSEASWPWLAPPHVAPGHSEVTGPPPPPGRFLAGPFPLPPRAPAELPALEPAREAPPKAEEESRLVPLLLPLPPPLLPPAPVPVVERKRDLYTGLPRKSVMVLLSCFGSLAVAAHRFLTASSYFSRLEQSSA